MKQLNVKKLVLLNLPYFLLGLFATSKKTPLWVETRPGFQGYVAPKETA